MHVSNTTNQKHKSQITFSHIHISLSHHGSDFLCFIFYHGAPIHVSRDASWILAASHFHFKRMLFTTSASRWCNSPPKRCFWLLPSTSMTLQKKDTFILYTKRNFTDNSQNLNVFDITLRSLDVPYRLQRQMHGDMFMNQVAMRHWSQWLV